MQNLETFLHHYGISHSELARLMHMHKSLVTRILQCHRPGRPYVEAFCKILERDLTELPAENACRQNFCSPAPAWLEQELIKADALQARMAELLRTLEKQQRQVSFWFFISLGAGDLKCGKAWAMRHYEEKLFKLRRNWEMHYLPLLLRLRETEARISILKGIGANLSMHDLLKPYK